MREFFRKCGGFSIAKLFRWCWPLPSFGWADLAFSDRLKLVAFFIQTGAGIAMTVFAAYAMYKLAVFKAIWPVFYLGGIALIIVTIVITGLAGLLIRRSVTAKMGPFEFKAQDSETAKAMMDSAPTTTTVTTPEGQPDVTTITPPTSS